MTGGLLEKIIMIKKILIEMTRTEGGATGVYGWGEVGQVPRPEVGSSLACQKNRMKTTVPGV